MVTLARQSGEVQCHESMRLLKEAMNLLEMESDEFGVLFQICSTCIQFEDGLEKIFSILVMGISRQDEEDQCAELNDLTM